MRHPMPQVCLTGGLQSHRVNRTLCDAGIHALILGKRQLIKAKGLALSDLHDAPRDMVRLPEWYVQVMAEVKRLDPTIQLLDAPAFFELYRQWLKQNPNAAKGLLKMREEP